MYTYIVFDISVSLITESLETPCYLKKVEIGQVGNGGWDNMLPRPTALQIAQFLSQNWNKLSVMDGVCV